MVLTMGAMDMLDYLCLLCVSSCKRDILQTYSNPNNFFHFSPLSTLYFIRMFQQHVGLGLSIIRECVCNDKAHAVDHVDRY